jgi:hypothetical protein
VMVYHARSYREIMGNPLYDPNRQGRMQRLEWAEDGTPIFGQPVPDGPHVIDPDPEADEDQQAEDGGAGEGARQGPVGSFRVKRRPADLAPA